MVVKPRREPLIRLIRWLQMKTYLFIKISLFIKAFIYKYVFITYSPSKLAANNWPAAKLHVVPVYFWFTEFSMSIQFIVMAIQHDEGDKGLYK